jgi:hypothetical protein
MHRSRIVNHFQTDGSVRAVIANAPRQMQQSDVKFLGECDESFCNILAAVLVQLNVAEPRFAAPGGGPLYSSPWEGIRHSKVLLPTSIRNGLAKNSTLEELSLHNMHPSDGANSTRTFFAQAALSSIERLLPAFPCTDDGTVKAFEADRGGTPVSDHGLKKIHFKMCRRIECC